LFPLVAGPPNVLTVRNVTTVAPRATPTAVIGGASPSQYIDIGLPRQFDGLPAYVPTTVQNPYDPRRCVYNWKQSNTRRLRAGHAKALAGIAVAEIGMGDSLTACFNGSVNNQSISWIRVYEALLEKAGIPIAGGGLSRINDGGATDPAWTLTGSWNSTTVSTFTFSQSIGSTASYTGLRAGSLVDFWYAESTASGSFTLSVDNAVSGGGFLSVGAGAVNAVRRVTLTPVGGDGIHTVKMTSTSAAACIALGAEVYRTAGLTIHNVAQSGSTASGPTLYTSWISADGSGLKAIYGTLGNYRPDQITAIHIAIGGNDLHSGFAVANIIAAITAMRGYFPNADVILYAEPAANQDNIAVWTPFYAALYALADTLDCPLFDLQDRLGDYATRVTDGLTGDTIAHLNRSGYAEWGKAIAMQAVA
jgi:hypothetical protein